MQSVKDDKERGQILVQVALMVVVLFAFVALALDVGHVYAGRRRMQNAADAGALAGAQAICFDRLSEDEAKEVAREYAVERNDSQGADVGVVSSIGAAAGYTVTVVTSQTLDTFFAGVINIDTAHVRAQAVARCGPASAARQVWPLAFDYDTFTNTVECGTEFMVFNDTSVYDKVDGEYVLSEECATGCSCADEGEDLDEEDPCYDKCDCDVFGPPIAPGAYGWLDLPSPADIGENYDIPEGCVETAGGKKWLECWIKNDFPALIRKGMCLTGEAGVMAATEDGVNGRTFLHGGEDADPYVNVVLWDRICDHPNDPDPLGQEGTPYHVAGFGCVEVIEYTKVDIFQCGIADPGPPDRCWNDVKVIRAKRLCPPDPETAYPGDPGWDQCRASGDTGGQGDPRQPWTVSIVE
ncbi:MAG: Tad domain-containing protein [Chloroflexota bacterium]|nr:Tad domain-containing protein [Chloroflexota bacterium]